MPHVIVDLDIDQIKNLLSTFARVVVLVEDDSDLDEVMQTLQQHLEGIDVTQTSRTSIRSRVDSRQTDISRAVVVAGELEDEQENADGEIKTSGLWSLEWKKMAIFIENESLPSSEECAILAEIYGPPPPQEWTSLDSTFVASMRCAYSAEELEAMQASFVDGVFLRSGGRPWVNPVPYVFHNFALHMQKARRQSQVYFLTVNVNWVLAKMLVEDDETFRSLIDKDLALAEEENPNCVCAISRAVRTSRSAILKADPAQRKQLASELLWNKLSTIRIADRYFHNFVHNLSSLRKLLAKQNGGPIARWPVLASAMDPLLHRFKGLDLGFLQAVAGLQQPHLFACTGSKGILAAINSETGHIVSSIDAHPGWAVHGLQSSRTHGLLISASMDTTCKLWRIKEPPAVFEEMKTFSHHKDSVRALRSRNSVVVSGSDDGTVLIWTIPDCKVLYELSQVHDGWVLGVDLHHSYESCMINVASCADDGLGYVWKDLPLDLNTSEATPMGKDSAIVLRGHENNVTSIHFLEANDNLRVVTGSADHTVRIWGLPTPAEGLEAVPLCILSAHHGEIRALTTWGDFLVSASADRTLKVWRVDPDSGAGELVTNLAGHADAINALMRIDDQFCGTEAAGRDGLAFLSVSDDKSVLWWDVEGLEVPGAEIPHLNVQGEETPEEQTQDTQTDDGVLRDSDANFIKAGSLGEDHSKEIVAERPSTNNNNNNNYRLSESPAPSYESSNDEKEKLQDMLEAEAEDHFMRSTVTALYVTPEHRFYGCNTGLVYAFDGCTGLLSTKLSGHTAQVNAICADKDFVVSGSNDQTVLVWNRHTWHKLYTLGAHISRVDTLRLCSGHRLFSGGRDKFIHLWDLDTGKLCMRLRGHTDGITAFSKIGGIATVNVEEIILSASQDKTIRKFNFC